MTFGIPTPPPLPGATLVSTANSSLFASIGSPAGSIASATTTDLGSVDTVNVTITGTNTITSFGSNANLGNGQFKWLQFTGSLFISQSGALLTPTGGSITVFPGDILLAQYNGSGNWKIILYLPNGQGGSGRSLLTADITYYVRTDGSDTNSGLANTSGGAWLTMQHAYDFIASRIDLGGHTVNVLVQNGTYTAGFVATQAWVGGGNVIFQGDIVTPSNVIINGAGDVFDITVPFSGVITVQGFRLSASAGGRLLAVEGGSGVLQFQAIEFGATSGAHIVASNGAKVICTGSYTILSTGSATAHWRSILLGILDFHLGPVVTIIDTPAVPNFTVAFADGQSCGQMTSVGSVAFVGTATGVRYSVVSNAVIDTNASGATYLPGNAGGTSASGGQYI